jgi:hypothetical protein
LAKTQSSCIDGKERVSHFFQKNEELKGSSQLPTLKYSVLVSESFREVREVYSSASSGAKKGLRGAKEGSSLPLPTFFVVTRTGAYNSAFSSLNTKGN